jgi:hypothetical protein
MCNGYAIILYLCQKYHKTQNFEEESVLRWFKQIQAFWFYPKTKKYVVDIFDFDITIQYFTLTLAWTSNMPLLPIAAKHLRAPLTNGHLYLN